MTRNTWMMGWFVLLAFAPAIASAACPEGMEGELRISARYLPGKNWAEFDKHVDGHLSYILKQMRDGSISSAGPMAKSDGEFDGGQAVYALTEFDKVERLSLEDPLVANEVVQVEYRYWRECRLAPPVAKAE